MLQHIVPEHYLKGFCDPEPSKRQGRVLWEFRLKDDVVRPRSPKNVGRIRDYYSIPKEAGVMDPAIEGALSKIESGAAPVIAKLRGENFNLSPDERTWVTAFIGFQMVRGPAFRDQVEAAVGTAGLLLTKAMGRRPEYLARILPEVPELKDKDWTPAEVADLARRAADAEKHFKIIGTPQSSLAMMSIAPDLLPHIFMLGWEFLVARGQAGFVTSDVPVTLRNPYAPAGFGAGLKMRGTELSFPISPRICLRAKCDPRLPPLRVLGVRDDIVRDLNRERARQAQFFIAGDNKATVEWTRQQYRELLARGEAHARPQKLLFIDGTGEREVVVEVDVEKYRQQAGLEAGT